MLTMAKVKVTTSSSPDWDMDPCKPAVAPTMKATQGSIIIIAAFACSTLRMRAFV